MNKTDKEFLDRSKIYLLYLKCVKSASENETRYNLVVSMLNEFPLLRRQIKRYLERS